MSAAALAQEADQAVSQIAGAPMRYPAAEHEMRRFVFPFVKNDGEGFLAANYSNSAN
jgi:hypothetical protein